MKKRSFLIIGVQTIQQQLAQQPTVNEFFLMYNDLFYDIPDDLAFQIDYLNRLEAKMMYTIRNEQTKLMPPETLGRITSISSKSFAMF